MCGARTAICKNSSQAFVAWGMEHGQLFDFLKMYYKSYDFPFSNRVQLTDDGPFRVYVCDCATSLYIDRGRNQKRTRTNANLGHTHTHAHTLYALSKLCPSQIWNSIMESDEKKRITKKKVLTHVPNSRRGPNFTLDMRVCDEDGGDCFHSCHSNQCMMFRLTKRTLFRVVLIYGF